MACALGDPLLCGSTEEGSVVAQLGTDSERCPSAGSFCWPVPKRSLGICVLGLPQLGGLEPQACSLQFWGPGV